MDQCNLLLFQLILLALCALCHAAPAPADIKETGLTRPSPINPEVLSDPKPAEKLVLLSADQSQHREKRNEHPPEKPHSIQAQEGLHGPPKNDAPAKPDSVKALEGLHGPPEAHKLEPHKLDAKPQAHHAAKRDIPVPTEVKTTAAPKEDKPHEGAVNAEAAPHVEEHHGSTTPHGPLRRHPVPVAELFNKTKPGSSEESKESKESAEKEGTKA